MQYKVGNASVKIRSFEHGLNSNDRPTDVGARYIARYPKYQCIDTINMILSNMTRKKGSEAINSAISSVIEGMAFYPQYSGSNALLMVGGGKLYIVNQSTGVLTEIYDLTGSGDANFVTAYDTCFVCNATEVVKVEGSDSYLVGIAAPSGASASAKAGGSLTLGTYKVIVGYARKVLGTNVLYSVGETLADVVLSGGNQTVTFSIPNSSDPQVNNKIVWMTDADSASPHYFYHETDDNTTVTFDVTSDANKNTALIYSTQAQENARPPAFQDITFLNNRVYGKIDNTIYYSKQAGTKYKLECFPSANTFDLPHYIVSLFTNDDHLYANCINQIIKIPFGDPYQRTVEIYGKTFSGTRRYYKYPRTVINHSDYVLGLSQDGVTKFQNDRMIPIDIAKDVKPDITEAYNGASATVKPAGILLRKNDRTEYHLSYVESTVGTTLNNRTLVLNLDTLSLDIDRNAAIISAWEKYDLGFDYGAVSPDGSTVFFGQSVSGKSVIYKLKSEDVSDTNVYVGDTFTASRDSESYVTTPYFVKDIRGSVKWREIHAAARQSGTYSIIIYAAKDKVYSATINFTKTGTGFILGTSRLGSGRLSSLYPTFSERGIPRTIKGSMVWAKIIQTAEDRTFQFIEAILDGKLTIGRRT